MHALKITATGWLQKIDIDPTRIADEIGCAEVQSAQLHHNVTLWFDATHSCMWREPNMSAACLMLNVGDHHPDTAPIPCGDIILLGAAADGTPADLHRHQYEALAYALLNSLAA